MWNWNYIFLLRERAPTKERHFRVHISTQSARGSVPEAKYLLRGLDDLVIMFTAYHRVPITQQCWYVEKGDCVYQARLSGGLSRASCWRELYQRWLWSSGRSLWHIHIRSSSGSNTNTQGPTGAMPSSPSVLLCWMAKHIKIPIHLVLLHVSRASTRWNTDGLHCPRSC